MLTSVHWGCVATAAITHPEHSVAAVPAVWNSPLEDDPAEVSCCNSLVDVESALFYMTTFFVIT